MNLANSPLSANTGNTTARYECQLCNLRIHRLPFDFAVAFCAGSGTTPPDGYNNVSPYVRSASVMALLGNHNGAEILKAKTPAGHRFFWVREKATVNPTSNSRKSFSKMLKFTEPRRAWVKDCV